MEKTTLQNLRVICKAPLRHIEWVTFKHTKDIYFWEEFEEFSERMLKPDSHGRRNRLISSVANVFNNLRLDTRLDVLEAYQSQRLKPNHTYQYGWKSHQLVAAWLGLPVPVKPSRLPKHCPHCGAQL